MCADPVHKGRGIRRGARRDREDRGIIGGQLVDDGEPRGEGRAMLGVNAAVDPGGEDDAAALLQTGEGVGPGRSLRAEVRAGDRNEAAAGRQARERGGDMAERGVGHAALDMDHGRERRVHEHDRRNGGGVEMIVDLGRVEAGDGNGRKERKGARRACRPVRSARASRRRSRRGSPEVRSRPMAPARGRRS